MAMPRGACASLPFSRTPRAYACPSLLRLVDLRLVPLDDPDEEGSTAWVLKVRGKGRRVREVPMPEEVMSEFSAYLGFRGLDPDPKAPRTHIS